MSPRARVVVFLVAGAVLLAVMLTGFSGLRPVGDYHGPYGKVIAEVAVPERHVTDTVSAVNFDYRSLDTLGEEFILFASVVGVTLLLRQSQGEKEHEGDDDEDESVTRNVPGPSDATRIAAQAFVGVTVLYGLYTVAHGQATPGGGFQGGVVLATVPLFVYLAGDPKTLRRIAPEWLVEAADAIGAGAFVVIGVIGLLSGAAFLANVFPLGPAPSKVTSGGTLLAIDWATAFEVAGGFVLLILAFLAEALSDRAKKQSGRESSS